MREIKFRAWIPDKEKMFSPVFLVDGEILDKEANLIADTSKGRVMPWGILMQYTGLKDKNGVEIYEGDVLAMPKISKEVYWIVEWKALSGFMHDGEDMPVGFTIKSNIPQHIHPDVIRLEVIGNIYENPELLEE